MLIDTHLHLSNEDYDIEEVIERAKKEGVNILITGGTNKENNLCDIELSKKYKNIYITLGYHPEEVEKVNIEEDLKILEQQIIENKEHVVGIGEIGLDYHYTTDNKDKQKELFMHQIDLANKYDLPVVVHSRDATNDTYNILKEKHARGVIHCFSGSIETAIEYIKIGFKLGIGGVVTFKNSNLKEVVKSLPLESIVLETDSPYLSPKRSEKNEPKNIKEIAIFISNLKGIDVDKVSSVTTENAKIVFNNLQI